MFLLPGGVDRRIAIEDLQGKLMLLDHLAPAPIEDLKGERSQFCKVY